MLEKEEDTEEGQGHFEGCRLLGRMMMLGRNEEFGKEWGY